LKSLQNEFINIFNSNFPQLHLTQVKIQLLLSTSTLWRNSSAIKAANHFHSKRRSQGWGCQ